MSDLDSYGSPPKIDRRKPSTINQPWWVLPLLSLQNNGVFIVGMVLSYFLDNATLFNVALGAAIMQANQSNSFWFGSTKGSQDKDVAQAISTAKKDDTIAKNAEALSVSAPVMSTITETKSNSPSTTVTKTEPKTE